MFTGSQPKIFTCEKKMYCDWQQTCDITNIVFFPRKYSVIYILWLLFTSCLKLLLLIEFCTFSVEWRLSGAAESRNYFIVIKSVAVNSLDDGKRRICGCGNG